MCSQRQTFWHFAIAIVLLGLCVWMIGCGPLRLELSMVPPQPRIQWEEQMSKEINDHELRLRALEGGTHAQ